MSRPSNIDFKRLVFFGDSLTDNGNLFALIGQPPSPPYAQRFSNGPTYAEYLPALIGVSAQNFAFGGAEAVTGPGDTPQQAFINLSAQVDRYIAGLNGWAAMPGTAAAFNIGSNDYLRYNPASGQPPPVAELVASINTQIQRLLAAGVEKIILFTLPSVAVTPLGNTLPIDVIAGANAINAANNAALKILAAAYKLAGIDVEVVDIGRLAQELDADAETFGFLVTDIPILGPNGQPTGITDAFDADEIAFMDGIHPTTAAHGVQAAFTSATLFADTVTLRDVGHDAIISVFGADLVLTGAGADRIVVGFGNDTVFGGLGDDTIDGGFGDDILSGGGGNDLVRGGFGQDVLAGGTGNDTLDGGFGNDILIAGRGSDSVLGGFGDDLILFKDEAGVADRDVVRGGFGADTARIEVSAAVYASAGFQSDLHAFVAGFRGGAFRDGEIATLGLRLESVERLEIVVDDALLYHAGRAAAPVDDVFERQLAAADLWGFF